MLTLERGRLVKVKHPSQNILIVAVMLWGKMQVDFPHNWFITIHMRTAHVNSLTASLKQRCDPHDYGNFKWPTAKSHNISLLSEENKHFKVHYWHKCIKYLALTENKQFLPDSITYARFLLFSVLFFSSNSTQVLLNVHYTPSNQM